MVTHDIENISFGCLCIRVSSRRDNTLLNTVGFEDTTSGLGVRESYTGTNLYPRKFSINLIWCRYHTQDYIILHKNVLPLQMCFCVWFSSVTPLRSSSTVDVRVPSPDLVAGGVSESSLAGTGDYGNRA